MQDAINFIAAMSHSLYNGLANTRMPVLNVSYLAFIIAVLVINLALWLIGVLTGGRQGKEKTGGRLDDNNNYIYRR